MKITFDPSVPEIAYVSRPGYKRPRKITGRWIVYREQRQTAGIFPDDIVFSALTCEACFQYLRDLRETQGNAAARA